MNLRHLVAAIMFCSDTLIRVAQKSMNYVLLR